MGRVEFGIKEAPTLLGYFLIFMLARRTFTLLKFHFGKLNSKGETKWKNKVINYG
jgi:hypothetical protein